MQHRQDKGCSSKFGNCTLGHNIELLHVVCLLLGGWLILCAVVALTAVWGDAEENNRVFEMTLWEFCDTDGGCTRLDLSDNLLTTNIKAAQGFSLLVMFSAVLAFTCNFVEFLCYRRAKHHLTLTALLLWSWAVFCGIVATGAFVDADVPGLDPNGPGLGFSILGWLLGLVQIGIHVWMWREQGFRSYPLCQPPPAKSNVFHLALTDIYKANHEAVPICIDVVIRALQEDAGHERLFLEECEPLELQRALTLMEQHHADLTQAMISEISPKVLCGVLLYFLEHLPEPVLGFAQYPSFLRAMDRLEDVFAAADGDNKFDLSVRKFYIQSQLVALPKAHFLVLRRIMELCVRVTESKTNHTDSRALSVVLRGKLGDYRDNWLRKFRPYKHSKPNSSVDQLAEEALIEFLIRHYDFLFFFNPHKTLDERNDEWQNMTNKLASYEEQSKKIKNDSHYLKSTLVSQVFTKRKTIKYFRAWKDYTQKSPALLEQRRRRMEELTEEVKGLRSKNMELERRLQAVSNELELKHMREKLSASSPRGALSTTPTSALTTTTTITGLSPSNDQKHIQNII